jgi:hypothetical protein
MTSSINAPNDSTGRGTMGYALALNVSTWRFNLAKAVIWST